MNRVHTSVFALAALVATFGSGCFASGTDTSESESVAEIRSQRREATPANPYASELDVGENGEQAAVTHPSGLGFGPSPDPWRRENEGPSPDPWRPKTNKNPPSSRSDGSGR